MIIQENICLANKTTMKIGGIAKLFYVPETENELIYIAQAIYDANERLLILSGGSNLLINDANCFEKIIYMGSACLEMKELGNNRFYIGASNRIQKVISFVNDHEYGGFEQLIGLPAMFGGIIYMNAGIGGERNSIFTISNFIDSVKVWDLYEKNILELSVDQCEFSHRYSIFHNQRYVILGATIHCNKISREESNRIKTERMKFCKEKFEYGKGCFGTCFSVANYKILKLVAIYDKIRKLGRKKVTFGKNNNNWLVNQGGGTFKDTIRIVKACKFAHCIFRDKIKCEIIIWE